MSIFVEAHNDFCYLEKEILRKTMERCNQAQEIQPKNAQLGRFVQKTLIKVRNEII